MKDAVQVHTGLFHYNNKNIPFHFWIRANSQASDTIIFLGTAQVERIPKWVAQSAPPGVVVVDGLPHWEAYPSARDLKEFSITYTLVAFKAVLATFNISSANLIASSQAAPGVICASKQMLDHVRNIGLITPLGFTAAVFGKSLKDRMSKLRLRAFHSLFQFSQSLFHDPRNVYIHFILLRALFLESVWGASDRKYAMGLSHDIIEDARYVSDKLSRKGNSITIFLGEKDRIFPPHEILGALKASGIKHIRTVMLPKVSHSSLAIRGNKEVLAQIVKTVRQ